MASVDAELLVIGGGFAGLRAAREAARAGLRVLVLERKRILGEPVRTSGASWISAMDALEVPPHLYHPVRIAHVYSRGRRSTLEYPEPPGCILHVGELVRHLGAEAEAAGAEVRVGVSARGLLERSGRVLGVETEEGPLRAGLVLDASGVAAFLARRLAGRGFERYGLGSEALLEAPAWPEEEIALWVGPPVAPSGYAWAFPEGGSRVRLGVGLLRPDHPGSARRALEELLASRRPELGPLAGAPRLELRTGAIPAQPPPLPLRGPGWLQVGDSAGQASPLLGEGIRFCLEMGALAGRAAAAALRSPSARLAERHLEGYLRAWEERYGAKFRLEHRLNRRLARLGPEGWDRAVALLDSLRGTVPLDILRGDWTPRTLLGLALRRPGLALELARGLARGTHA